MALNVSPVHRNLHTRVTFMALEFEDLFIVLGLAALMNVLSHLVTGGVGVVLQYGVPLSSVPLLMLFKYGKPRRYFGDLLDWHLKPRSYCAITADRRIRHPYIKEQQ